MTISVRGGTSGDAVPPSHPPNNSTTPAQQSGQSSEPSQQQDSENSIVQNDDSASLLLPNGEVVFPLAELSKLDEMINRPRWVVPVLPKGELEVLLEASIKLCRAGNEKISIDPKHAVAMLSPWRTKSFVFACLKSFSSSPVQG